MELGFINISHTTEGPRGVNGQHFINMEPYLNATDFEALHMECVLGLSYVDKFDLSFVVGEIPPERRAEYDNMYLESEILTNLDHLDPTGIHRKNMTKMTIQQRRRYCYLALGALSPWYGTCYLRRNDFAHKRTTPRQELWTNEAQYFPQLKKYITEMEGTLFSEIGRVMFFISYPLNPVVIHRDHAQVKHKDHCINFFFNKGRPSFIYDERLQQRHYLNPNCRAYFFNNRDYHGVDAEPEMRYTLRIDGTFTKDLSEKIGLQDGWVW